MISFRKKAKKTKRQELKKSDAFLWQCFKLVIVWIFFFALIIAFFSISISNSDYKKWSGTLCSCICAIDGIISLRMFGPYRRIFRDPMYNESHVKKEILKISCLSLMNFKFNVAFIAWMWYSDENNKLTQYLIYGCLIAGIVAIKICFVLSCLRLKKFLSKLFVDFHKIENEESSEPVSVKIQESPIETLTEETKLIE